MPKSLEVVTEFNQLLTAEIVFCWLDVQTPNGPSGPPSEFLNSNSLNPPFPSLSFDSNLTPLYFGSYFVKISIIADFRVLLLFSSPIIMSWGTSGDWTVGARILIFNLIIAFSKVCSASARNPVIFVFPIWLAVHLLSTFPLQSWIIQPKSKFIPAASVAAFVIVLFIARIISL